MTYDSEIAKSTFKRLEDSGIGIPLSGIVFSLPPLLSKEEQGKLRASKENFRKESGYKRKRKYKSTGFGQAQSAFLRALAARDFDISDCSAVSKGNCVVSFKAGEWDLLKDGKVLHSQPYGAGSIKVIDRYCK